MKNYKECPDCGTYDTEQVYQEMYSDMVEVVLICDDCALQFTAKFQLFDREVDMRES